MRLFVALWPPDHVLDQLTSQLTGPRAEFRQLAWTDVGRAHITLLFLGAVADDVVDRLADDFQGACASMRPVRIRLAGAGHFGRSTLWAGIDGDTDQLAWLHRLLAEAAGRWGLVVPDHPWSAHLTLARGRRRGDVRPAVDALRTLVTDPWTAMDAHLVHSDTQPSRAVYRNVRALPFTS